MGKITIDLVKLIEQAIAQISGSVDPVLLQQWLDHNSGVERPVTIDLAAVLAEGGVDLMIPALANLRPRVNDVTTFSDESELRIHVLAPRGSGADLATDAYLDLLAAISNI